MENDVEQEKPETLEEWLEDIRCGGADGAAKTARLILDLYQRVVVMEQKILEQEIGEGQP